MDNKKIDRSLGPVLFQPVLIATGVGYLSGHQPLLHRWGHHSNPGDSLQPSRPVSPVALLFSCCSLRLFCYARTSVGCGTDWSSPIVGSLHDSGSRRQSVIGRGTLLSAIFVTVTCVRKANPILPTSEASSTDKIILVRIPIQVYA